MGVYIKGMEMPKSGYKVVYIHSNGGVYEPSNSEHVWSKLATAIPVPDHGRLIDADKIYDAVEQRYRMSSGIEHRCERDLLDLICAAPTIIPAEREEE